MEGVNSNWVSVARLTNLAEAGFLQNLLSDEGVASNVKQHEDFSAVDGKWTSVYVMQVPAGLAHQAVVTIRQELADSTSDDPQSSNGSEADQPAPVVWKPLAIIFVAGGLAYLASQNALPWPGRPADTNHRQSFWEAIDGIAVPWVSDPAENGPRFRLRFDRGSNTVYLDEDRDRNGRYERRRKFRRDDRHPWTEFDPR